MSLVIDANVAIKWFVTENLHVEARRLLHGRHDLHAPDFLVVELANVAWKKARRREITRQQAAQISTACLDGVPSLHPSSALAERAIRSLSISIIQSMTASTSHVQKRWMAFSLPPMRR